MLSNYQLLGVTQASTDRELKVAYMKLARAHHPDKRAELPTSSSVDSSSVDFAKIHQAYTKILSHRKDILHQQSSKSQLSLDMFRLMEEDETDIVSEDVGFNNNYTRMQERLQWVSSSIAGMRRGRKQESQAVSVPTVSHGSHFDPMIQNYSFQNKTNVIRDRIRRGIHIFNIVRDTCF